jgi:hypothetical protein
MTCLVVIHDGVTLFSALQNKFLCRGDTTDVIIGAVTRLVPTESSTQSYGHDYG